MGTRAELTIKDSSDFILMDTRWDGYDEFVLEKLNKENGILKFRAKLENFVKGKEMDSQIEFLTKWIASIDRFLASQETISKVASLISFGDFSHFKSTVESIDFNGSTNISSEYVIDNVNGDFKFIFNDEKIDERLEYEDVTKEEYLESLKESKYLAFAPLNQKFMNINEKPLKDDDILIKVFDIKEAKESDLKPKDFSVSYIKMKNGSVKKFAEIIYSLAFNYAYLYEVGEFSVNSLIAKNEIDKKAKKLEEETGMDYWKARRKVQDDVNQDNVYLGFNSEYSINMFSSFNHDNEKTIKKAFENVKNGLEPSPFDNKLKNIFSFPPFSVYAEMLIHQLIFFYPDMFEVLTASEMKYVINNNRVADISCKLEDTGTCKITVDFEGLLNSEDLRLASNGLINIEKYINTRFEQSLLNIAFKNSEGFYVSWNQPFVEGLKVSYNYELAVATTMNSYDNYLFNKNIDYLTSFK